MKVYLGTERVIHVHIKQTTNTRHTNPRHHHPRLHGVSAISTTLIFCLLTIGCVEIFKA